MNGRIKCGVGRITADHDFKITWLYYLIFTVLYEMKTQWIEEICDTPAELMASRDPAGACFDEAWRTVGGKKADF
ncbi:hypothetical protein FQP34_15475 [Peribacillus simplex]|uniref:Uncharacterized protein n=1 Tax=Peribacillus simplex TaxID=1478 RepID=A0A8B5XX64_9BACI|nr:hypothetical protein FQP34_15475 [Peribacillus simplex]